MRKRNIVITGGNGYLGSHLVKLLIENGDQVWVIIRSPDSDLSRLAGYSNYHRIICPLERVEELQIACEKVDVCYHLAWLSGSKQDQSDLYAQEAFIVQSIRLMDAMRAKGCTRFIGTGSILETNTDLPVKSHPHMSYAIAKDCTNKFLMLRAKELGVRYTWCRLCGLYGDDDRTGNLVSYTISQLQNGKSPEYSAADQPYSFIHVEDCAAVLRKIGASLDEIPETLQISGPECLSIREYMTIIQRCIAPEIPLKFGVRMDDGIRYTDRMFDNTFLKRRLGIRYLHDFEQEIRSKQ